MYVGGNSNYAFTTTRIEKHSCSLVFECNNGLNTVKLNGNIADVALAFYHEINKYFGAAYSGDFKLYDLIIVNLKEGFFKIKYIGSDEPYWFKEFSRCFIKISELRIFL